jgi:ABC-type transport system involved in multi-copper enzyme maturation permease subunit
LLWHITKREIYDHFTSLRFALTVGIITLLMVLNGLIFVGSDYEQRLSEYSQNVTWIADRVKASCQNLNKLAMQGPGGFYKRPSPLAFCANDQEDELPIRIRAQGGIGTNMWGGRTPERTYSFETPWRLEYPQDTYQGNSMTKSFTALDWSFIVGVVMSFVAILFSFDAISGERESGTLKLTLSNSVPRGAILLGKFLGVFIAIAIPLLIGMLLSLLIVMLSGSVALGGSDWARIGSMIAISFIYIALFVGLGLAISSRMARSSTSLLVLLLTWVVLVVLVPNTLGCVVSTLRKAPSQLEFEERRDAAMKAIGKSMDDLFKYGSPTQPEPDIKAIELWADYVTTRLEIGTRLNDERLAAQFAQVQLARQILRAASPTTIYDYVMESLAGTGFARHRQFVQAAQRYRGQFAGFIKVADRADPNSHHLYYLKEGLSEKPVNFENVPRFVETTSISAAVENALTNLGLLVLLSVVFFLAGFVAFLRCDVR